MNHPSLLPPFLQAWDACHERANRGLPDALVQASRRNFFDTLAALAAGVRERCTQAAYQSCGVNDSSQLSTTDAALVLGTASHALDYDDVCMLATCHPSAPVVSAMLALQPLLQTEQPNLTYQSLIAAYAVGTETLLRLGEWLGFRHYALGFHATSTLGTVGVAAAVSHLLQLNREQAHAALSIAASSACGLRANFGSDTKPLHVGFAAAAGLRAVMLARAGANASNDVWREVSGFPYAFNGGEVPMLPWQGDAEWALIQPGFEHKRFPSCYMTHRLIAGVLAIRKRQPQGLGQTVQIDIEMPKNGTAPLKHPQPVTGLQAKFSGQYCAAAAWRDGQVSLSTFDDALVAHAPLMTQMSQVQLRERSTPTESLDTAPVAVSVRGEGWTDHILVDWAPGSPADPMTREDLRQKWQDCARQGGLTTGEASMMNLLDAPLNAPARDFLQPLRQALMSAITQPNLGTSA